MEIDKPLNALRPISLEEMDGVKLMNRIDTKYVTSVSRLVDILDKAQAHYQVQEINGKRLLRYDTLYYDTERLDMYICHHNRHLVRQKVRIRSYVDNTGTFLEIKNKNNKGRTKKKRILVDSQDAILHPNEEVSMFMEERCWYPMVNLVPTVRTQFARITLVNDARTERLTIDLNLKWTNASTGVEKGLDGLVIIELKRDGNAPSPMLQILRDMRIRPMGMSKYCIGVVLTHPEAKHNRFNNKMRKLAKILNK